MVVLPAASQTATAVLSRALLGRRLSGQQLLAVRPPGPAATCVLWGTVSDGSLAGPKSGALMQPHLLERHQTATRVPLAHATGACFLNLVCCTAHAQRPSTTANMQQHVSITSSRGVLLPLSLHPCVASHTQPTAAVAAAQVWTVTGGLLLRALAPQPGAAGQMGWGGPLLGGVGPREVAGCCALALSAVGVPARPEGRSLLRGDAPLAATFASLHPGLFRPCLREVLRVAVMCASCGGPPCAHHPVLAKRVSAWGHQQVTLKRERPTKITGGCQRCGHAWSCHAWSGCIRGGARAHAARARAGHALLGVTYELLLRTERPPPAYAHYAQRTARVGLAAATLYQARRRGPLDRGCGGAQTNVYAVRVCRGTCTDSSTRALLLGTF